VLHREGPSRAQRQGKLLLRPLGPYSRAVGIERLVLFDIDGTLVAAGELGAEVFDRAIEAVVGKLPPRRLSMSGKTDPLIVREHLELLDLDGDAHLPLVLSQLERELAAVAKQLAISGRALPGAPQLLEALARDERLHLSVLTGNIAPNALVKLSAFGLDKWLDLETGAYGSDSEVRSELVPVALRKLARRRGVSLSPDQAWVVGDTPRDFEAAKAAGAHAVLVATGRFGVAELSELGADAVLADLSATEQVVELLTTGLDRHHTLHEQPRSGSTPA
jgi:phosphoglycolate phosphatase